MKKQRVGVKMLAIATHVPTHEKTYSNSSAIKLRKMNSLIFLFLGAINSQVTRTCDLALPIEILSPVELTSFLSTQIKECAEQDPNAHLVVNFPAEKMKIASLTLSTNT